MQKGGFLCLDTMKTGRTAAILQWLSAGEHHSNLVIANRTDAKNRKKNPLQIIFHQETRNNQQITANQYLRLPSSHNWKIQSLPAPGNQVISSTVATGNGAKQNELM